MVDITHKNTSLRKAIASARLTVSSMETIKAVVNKTVPKGDVFEFARAAGLLAIKKTSDVIPDCHPLPVEYAAITYSMEEMSIIVQVEVHTIYKTGVEVEAMHGAAITALTIYDMLKPIDKGVEIGSIRLDSKKGGKSDWKSSTDQNISCAVVVCSDSVAAGTSEDVSGKAIIAKLKIVGLNAPVYEVVPDDFSMIQDAVKKLSASGIRLIVCTGGTGLSARDVTPDAVRPLIEREIPGIMEAARNYGQQRTPYAMLSRGVAGFVARSLVITMPGSVRAVEETFDAIFPQVLHLFKIEAGERHDQQ